MKIKKPTKRTATSIAVKLGVSRSTLYEWKAAGAPIDRGEAAVLEWAMREARKPNEPDDLRAARLSVLKQTARRLKLANDMRSGQMLTKDEIASDIAAGMGALFSGLERAFAEIPNTVAGLQPSEIKARLDATFATLTQGLRQAFARIGGDTAEGTPAFNAGERAIDGLVFAEVRGLALKERVDQEYETFRRWLKEEVAIRSEKRAEWCRLRAAAGLPVPNATDAELARFPGLKRA